MTNHPNRGRSDTQVTLIRYHSGFQNVADKFEVKQGTPYGDNWSEETYWLPNGYTVSSCAVGTLEIYDAKDNHCDVVEHNSGRPQLISVAPNMPVLKPCT